MSFGVQIGLLLSVATAFVSILGFLYKQRGAVDAPPIDPRHPVRSTIALFENRWWTIGIIVAMGSWFLHTVALGLAPITLVQSTIAGGLVLLTVVADRMFGLSVTKRDWIGVGLTALGLAFLAATLGGTADSRHSDYDTLTLAIYVTALFGVTVPLMLSVGRFPDQAGVVLGLCAGLQWGASDVTIKAGTNEIHEHGLIGGFLTPLTVVIVVISLVGLVVSARSLQLGSAVAVIAVTSAAANLCTIVSGLVVFGEPLPDGTLARIVRLLALALVIGAAALIPGPVGAGPERAEPPLSPS